MMTRKVARKTSPDVVQQAYVSATIWPDLPAIAKQGFAGTFRTGNQKGFLEQGEMYFIMTRHAQAGTSLKMEGPASGPGLRCSHFCVVNRKVGLL
jgi:hypothetical protein